MKLPRFRMKKIRKIRNPDRNPDFCDLCYGYERFREIYLSPSVLHKRFWQTSNENRKYVQGHPHRIVLFNLSDGSVNLQDGQREECARSSHVRELFPKPGSFVILSNEKSQIIIWDGSSVTRLKGHSTIKMFLNTPKTR